MARPPRHRWRGERGLPTRGGLRRGRLCPRHRGGGRGRRGGGAGAARSAPAPPAPSLERIDAAGLAAVATEWDALIAASTAPSPFLTSAWIGAWLATLGEGADLEVVTARDADDGSPGAAAPFFAVARTPPPP